MTESALETSKINPANRRLVLVLGFALLANALAGQVAGIVAVSGIITSAGGTAILGVFFINAALLVLTGSFHSRMPEKYDRVKLLPTLALIFGISFLIIRLIYYSNAPSWVAHSVLFIFTEQQLIAFPLIFWVFADDLFNAEQAKQIFPKIANWNMTGKFIGIMIAAFSPAFLQLRGFRIEDILFVNVIIYILGYFILRSTLNKQKLRKTIQFGDSIKFNWKEGIAFIRDVPSFKIFLNIAIILAAVKTILEYHFLVVTNLEFQTQGFYQTFYSYFRFTVLIFTLLAQFLVVKSLAKDVQTKDKLFFYPVTALISAIALLILPGSGIVILGMVLIFMTRDTIHAIGRKDMQKVVPHNKRSQISQIFGSYAPSVGVMISSLGVLALITLLGQSPSASLYYLSIAGVLSLTALVAVYRVRAVYDSSLLSWRFERRKKPKSTVNTALLDRISD